MTHKLGIIGLGKIGGNLILQAVEKNVDAIGKTRHKKPHLEKEGIRIVYNYHDFVFYLDRPRVVYLSLPAGETVDTVLDELSGYLDEGDVVMDGGNSFYVDSIRREKKMQDRGIYFLDCGTSGGIEGARNGACFMVGGREDGIKIAEPVLRKLSVDGGYIHTGEPGSGHFTKLVHNGIEFGMMQAIGEGFDLLMKSGFELNYADIFRNWSNGSVIRGWLVELMEKSLRENEPEEVESYIEDTGEVNWLVQDAINKEIPIPIISQSIMELFRSREESNSIYRAIALMRHQFGGHPFGKDEHIQRERKVSRVEKL